MSKETGLVVEGQFPSIPEVLLSIDTQIAQLKDVETSKFKTSMNLAPFGGDLKKVKDVPTLVKAFSFIRSKGKAYVEAGAELGVAGLPTFKEDNGTVEQWKSDIELQIRIVTHKERLEELKAIKSKAETFLSQEDQKSMFFADLMKTLGK